MSRAEVLELEAESPVIGDEVLFEIVNDQRVELPPMGVNETVMASRLCNAIAMFSFSHKLGEAVTETLFRLKSKPNLQRRPDVAFVSYTRWAKGRRIPRGNAWDVVPDLAVEIVSPTNLALEVPTKVREYFEGGVRRVWFFFPDESVVYDYDSPRSIRVLGWDDQLDGGEVIPGFQLPLTELFDPVEPPQEA